MMSFRWPFLLFTMAFFSVTTHAFAFSCSQIRKNYVYGLASNDFCRQMLPMFSATAYIVSPRYGRQTPEAFCRHAEGKHYFVRSHKTASHPCSLFIDLYRTSWDKLKSWDKIKSYLDIFEINDGKVDVLYIKPRATVHKKSRTEKP